MLPFLEHSTLHTQLAVTRDRLGVVTADPVRIGLLRTSLPFYLCPSDASGIRSHINRTLSSLAPIGPIAPGPAAFHHPGHTPTASITVAKSNYVASFGDGWDPTSGMWSISRLQGNGVYGCNSNVKLADITDGTSSTFAAGERSWDSYAAVWVGVDQWTDCTTHGVSMVLGTVFYKPNIAPDPYALSCDGRGSAGFGSRHPGGAQFVMCDGSVQFIGETIDFQNSAITSNLGVYQRLGQRSDGEPVHGY
jgi:prepilin-type processing-associated H-X9-DG protein